MSESKEKSNPTRNGKKSTGERVITKEKHVPTKVIVGNVPDIDFRPAQKHMKGAITVVVSNGSITKSWTVHHPIGVTDLDPADWVNSVASDVPVLLAHRTDDDATRKAQVRAKYREKLATTSNPPILAEDAEGNTIYPGTGNRRAEVVRDARIRAQNHYETALTKWKKAGSRKNEEPVLEPYVAVIKAASDRSTERRFTDFSNLEAVKKEVLDKYPDDFRTRSGPKLDQDQVSAGIEGFPASTGQAFDAVCYHIETLRIAPRGILDSYYAGEDLYKTHKALPSLNAPAAVEEHEESESEESQQSSDPEPSDEEEEIPSKTKEGGGS